MSDGLIIALGLIGISVVVCSSMLIHEFVQAFLDSKEPKRLDRFKLELYKEAIKDQAATLKE